MNRYLKAILIAFAWIAVSQFIVISCLYNEQRLSLNDPSMWFTTAVSSIAIFPLKFAIIMGILERSP